MNNSVFGKLYLKPIKHYSSNNEAVQCFGRKIVGVKKDIVYNYIIVFNSIAKIFKQAEKNLKDFALTIFKFPIIQNLQYYFSY